MVVQYFDRVEIFSALVLLPDELAAQFAKLRSTN